MRIAGRLAACAACLLLAGGAPVQVRGAPVPEVQTEAVLQKEGERFSFLPGSGRISGAEQGSTEGLAGILCVRNAAGQDLVLHMTGGEVLSGKRLAGALEVSFFLEETEGSRLLSTGPPEEASFSVPVAAGEDIEIRCHLIYSLPHRPDNSWMGEGTELAFAFTAEAPRKGDRSGQAESGEEKSRSRPGGGISRLLPTGDAGPWRWAIPMVCSALALSLYGRKWTGTGKACKRRRKENG